MRIARNALCALALACGPSTVIDGDGGIPGDDAGLTRPLDLLFVIDNSSTMIEEQTQLIAAFGGFLAELTRRLGALPSLHIGVISSNMGTAPYVVVACDRSDAGVLQSAPRVTDCSPPSGSYLIDVPDDRGGRERNYTGDLAETFSCIAALGNQGCGFEQHLAAMRAALDGRNAANAGFVRDGAVLGVVILADEDDCSADDPAMFNPDASMGGLDGPLGPFTSFRCTEFGVECDGLPVGRTATAYDNCKPAAASPYMPHSRVFADFLRQQKGDQVAVVTIAGPTAPFQVELSPADGYPELTPSCTGPTGVEAPAVRLAAVASELGGGGMFTTGCADDYRGTMLSAAQFLADALVR